MSSGQWRGVILFPLMKRRVSDESVSLCLKMGSASGGSGSVRVSVEAVLLLERVYIHYSPSIQGGCYERYTRPAHESGERGGRGLT